jgi:hypothetical protein
MENLRTRTISVKVEKNVDFLTITHNSWVKESGEGVMGDPLKLNH